MTLDEKILGMVKAIYGASSDESTYMPFAIRESLGDKLCAGSSPRERFLELPEHRAEGEEVSDSVAQGKVKKLWEMVSDAAKKNKALLGDLKLWQKKCRAKPVEAYNDISRRLRQEAEVAGASRAVVVVKKEEENPDQGSSSSLYSVLPEGSALVPDPDTSKVDAEAKLRTPRIVLRPVEPRPTGKPKVVVFTNEGDLEPMAPPPFALVRASVKQQGHQSPSNRRPPTRVPPPSPARQSEEEPMAPSPFAILMNGGSGVKRRRSEVYEGRPPSSSAAPPAKQRRVGIPNSSEDVTAMEDVVLIVPDVRVGGGDTRNRRRI